jgi:hypothetical protein
MAPRVRLPGVCSPLTRLPIAESISIGTVSMFLSGTEVFTHGCQTQNGSVFAPVFYLFVCVCFLFLESRVLEYSKPRDE